MPTFDPRGEIRFDDVTLRRPKIGELWELEDVVRDALQGFQAEAEAIAAELAEAGDPLPDELAERAVEFRRKGALRHLEPFYRRTFQILGDGPLPKDPADWDVELLTWDLPRQMLDHWRMNPKASGENPPD